MSLVYIRDFKFVRLESRAPRFLPPSDLNIGTCTKYFALSKSFEEIESKKKRFHSR